MDADDELDDLSNVCADLVSLRRWEPALVSLFRVHPAGVWVRVADLMAQVETDQSGVPADLSVAWLASTTDSGYAVLSFYADDLKWSTSAVYNVARLLKVHQPVATA